MKAVFIVAISDEFVNNNYTICSRDALLGLKTALMYVTEIDLFEQELPLLEIIAAVQKRSHSRLIQPPIESFFFFQIKINVFKTNCK